jgi:hypothetical protein
MRIARRLYGEKGALIRTLIFFALLAPLPYTWWYFDLITVFLTLIALDALLLRKEASSGTFIAMGMLAKWFPALLLPAVFRTWPLKKVLRTALMIEGAELESAVDFIPTDTDLADVAMRKGYVVGHASSAGGTRQDGGFWGLRIFLVSTNFHTQDDREHKYLDQIQNL